MKNLEIGSFVYSKAGHDADSIYIVIKITGKKLTLVDGRIKTLEKPKFKNEKHVNVLTYYDKALKEKLNAEEKLTNEEIKYAIKNYRKQKDMK